MAAVIKKELGAAVDDVFFFFERAPIASATVAQVHKAFLSPDGRSDAVAVKVRMPVRDDTGGETCATL